MTKRGYIRLFSYAIAFAAVLSIYAIMNMTTANSYKAQLELNYQQSLNELSENLDSIETNLTKSVYSNSDKMLMDISKDLYAECSQAKDALSRLPVEQMNLNSTYKFITQASDYASYIANKIAANQSISDEEHQNLTKLLKYSKELNESVSNMATIANNGADIDTDELKAKEMKISSLSHSFSATSKVFKDYPTLLYDGPFADAVLNRKSTLLEKAEQVSRENAREVAAKALGCNISEVTYSGEDSGDMPCYTFTYSQKTIGITKKGGYVAYILYGGKINRSSIDKDNAINLAQSYLNMLGYSNMENTYYATNNNICTINFAYKTGNTTYYADLIKVGVSMDNGKIVSLEAQGYLTNHIKRKGFDCKLTKSEAQSKLSKNLEVINCKKCVIPKENGKEANCYEFRCKSSETKEEVLIYIDADKGYEEDIMLLLYSDGGTLTK